MHSKQTNCEKNCRRTARMKVIVQLEIKLEMLTILRRTYRCFMLSAIII